MAEADPFAPLHGGGRRLADARPPAAPGEDFAAVLPAPATLPVSIRHKRRGAPASVWRYHDATGALLFAVCRFETADGKEVLPYTFGRQGAREGWHWRAPPAPRPLFGLDALAARPNSPVLVA